MHTTLTLKLLLLGLALCLHVQQMVMRALGPLKRLHSQSLPLLGYLKRGKYVKLVISYVQKWMEVRTMHYLEGEYSHIV